MAYFGRIDWTRTSDLFVPNEAFYQAELQSALLKQSYIYHIKIFLQALFLFFLILRHDASCCIIKTSHHSVARHQKNRPAFIIRQPTASPIHWYSIINQIRFQTLIFSFLIINHIRNPKIAFQILASLPHIFRKPRHKILWRNRSFTPTQNCYPK